ncbi:1-acyl-sn-glycerol-3-phosphate acyltransferase [Chloroflexi bacterium]|nr:1-acyl-sn-glycerol-3-phosphate acyltransferase [Chloroflexota bacterium]
MLYSTCNLLQKITLNFFCNFEVLGKENIPPVGPLIVVSNHLSNIDPSIVAVSVSRRLKFMAKSTLFAGPFISTLLKWYGAYPLKRDRIDVASFKWALSQLREDGAILIFPEGTRSNGSMIKAKAGVARLVQMSDATILPIAITGTESIGNVLRVVNPTGNIKVNIGSPFSLPKIDGPTDSNILKSMTDLIMERISILLPETYRGVYSIERRSKVK